MAIADTLLSERIRARDRAIHGLQIDQEWVEEAYGDAPEELVKRYVKRATAARRTLDRHWWLRATADVVLETVDERRSLLRLAARHISATHALSAKERSAAIRFLFAKAVPVA